MIKTSRWKQVLFLEKKSQPLYDTLAAALGGIASERREKTDQCSSGLPGELGRFP